MEQIKEIIELGSIGIALTWIYYLRSEIKELRTMLVKSEDAHKQDLKTHATNLQSVFENLVGENMSLINLVQSTILEIKSMIKK